MLQVLLRTQLRRSPRGNAFKRWEGSGGEHSDERSDVPSPGSPQHVGGGRCLQLVQGGCWRSCPVCVGCLQCRAVAILGGRELLWGHHTAHSPRRSPR